MTRARYEQIGQIGIDTAQVYIGDPCLIERYQSFGDFIEEHDLMGGDLSKQIGDQTAIVAQTGYGDGIYPVYARIKDGRIMQITIDFELR